MVLNRAKHDTLSLLDLVRQASKPIANQTCERSSYQVINPTHTQSIFKRLCSSGDILYWGLKQSDWSTAFWGHNPKVRIFLHMRFLEVSKPLKLSYPNKKVD